MPIVSYFDRDFGPKYIKKNRSFFGIRFQTTHEVWRDEYTKIEGVLKINPFQVTSISREGFHVKIGEVVHKVSLSDERSFWVPSKDGKAVIEAIEKIEGPRNAKK